MVNGKMKLKKTIPAFWVMECVMVNNVGLSVDDGLANVRGMQEAGLD